jgi:hypothetical protein
MPTKHQPRIWMYKTRNQPGQAAWGNWRSDFFDEVGPGGAKWGGEWGISSKESLSILQKHMRAGDLVIAYQIDTQEIVGLCRVRRVAEFEPGKGLEMDLVPICLFSEPVLIHKLKRELDPKLKTVSALKSGHVGTLYWVSPEDAALLARHFPFTGRKALAGRGIPKPPATAGR